MPRYKIPVEVYVYGEVSVLAETLDEAMEKAGRYDGQLSYGTLDEHVAKLKVDGVLPLKPEVRKASGSYKKLAKEKKVRVRKGTKGDGITVTSKGRRGRSRG